MPLISAPRRTFALFAVLLAAVTPTAARAQMSNAWVTTYSNYAAPGGLQDSLESSVRILVDPSDAGTPADYMNLFWAFNGATSGGVAFYIGLQRVSTPAVPGMKLARFSIWDATEATPGPSAACRAFDGEGVGRTCERSYAWTSGVKYGVRVRRVGENTFVGEVRAGDGPWEALGTIVAPSTAGQLTYANWFTEYFGPWFPSCASLPTAIAEVSPPVAGDGSQGAHAGDAVGEGNCMSGRRVITNRGGTASFHYFNLPGPVEECALGIADCDDDAVCSETDPSYTCACGEGLEGDGLTCVGPDAGLLDAGAHADAGAESDAGAAGNNPPRGSVVKDSPGCAVGGRDANTDAPLVAPCLFVILSALGRRRRAPT